MELDSAAKFRYAFYRLCGTISSDDALVENGESADDVAYLYLTRGVRAAQRWMIDRGMSERWRKRSSALSFSGSDAADGGRYTSLPTDFLRLSGSDRKSSLLEADNARWGSEITHDFDDYEGDYFYLKADRLYLARSASPPTVYLDYQYAHAAFSAGLATFDFPVDARSLIVAEAADAAKSEGWFPRSGENIREALAKARDEAEKITRRTRTPRSMVKPSRMGNNW